MSVTRPTPPRFQHIPALDGLRGAAVLGVLSFHGGYLKGGYLGVDLFFVLSGYLITSLLVAEQERAGQIRLGAFWARRARRLLPATLSLLLGVSAYAAFVARPTELGRIRSDAFAALLYVANWRSIFAGNDYWALFRAPSPLEHMWSLSIEEQFYLVWPLIVAGTLAHSRSSGRRRLTVLTALLYVASVADALLLFSPMRGGARVYFGTDTRAAAILIGSLLALTWPVQQGDRHTIWWNGAALTAFALLMVAWATLDGSDPRLYQGGLLLCGAGAAVVIGVVAHHQQGWLARLLSVAPLRWLGNISYGLYLWHWPVFVLLTKERAHVGGALLFGLRLSVSLLISIASYFAIEQPLRRGAFPGWKMALVAPLTFLAVSAAVLASTSDSIAPQEPGREIAGASDGRKVDSQHHFLVVGDSVGASLASAGEQVAGALGVQIDNRSVVGCGLVRGSQRIRLPDGKISVRATCRDWESRWAGDVEQTTPDVVLLVLGAPTIGSLDIDGRWLHPCEPAFDAAYAREARRAIEVLGSRGAAVLIATAPYVDQNEDYADNRARTDCINRVYEAETARAPFSETVDLGRRVCPSFECAERQNGFVLRPDGTHFDPQSAPLILTWLVDAARVLPIDKLMANNPARRR
jgi:peptidoglycan/LPS O-acetylase OafA/YrhL